MSVQDLIDQWQLRQVLMESGLRGRNNIRAGRELVLGRHVSMNSGLSDRNNGRCAAAPSPPRCCLNEVRSWRAEQLISPLSAKSYARESQ